MQVERYIAKGQIVPLLFSEDAVAASQTDAQLPLMAVDAVASLVDGYAMPWDGEVVGISAALDSAASAGSLAIGATVGGTEDADSTITFATETELYKSIPRGKITFVAGDLIGAEITTDGSWNGTTSDLIVQVWVLLFVEGI
jgi:hypothetical protein